MMNGVISAGTETAAARDEFLERRARVRRVVAHLGVDVDGGHLREPDQQSRDDAGEVQRADRHRQHAAPHDHQDRRRDDHGQHRRDRGDGDRERQVVAFLDLRLDEDLALARGVGGRRSGDAREEHRQQHVDLRQRARESCRPSSATAHQPVGDAADVHQVRRQQEERHREQDERVVGLERRVEDDHRREPRLDEQHRQAREPERERDRHAQDHAAGRTCRTATAPRRAGVSAAPVICSAALTARRLSYDASGADVAGSTRSRGNGQRAAMRMSACKPLDRRTAAR